MYASGVTTFSSAVTSTLLSSKLYHLSSALFLHTAAIGELQMMIEIWMMMVMMTMMTETMKVWIIINILINILPSYDMQCNFTLNFSSYVTCLLNDKSLLYACTSNTLLYSIKTSQQYNFYLHPNLSNFYTYLDVFK